MWTDEQLEEMGMVELFDKVMFLSGCDKHRAHFDWIDGYIVTEENMKKFAELIIRDSICRDDAIAVAHKYTTALDDPRMVEEMRAVPAVVTNHRQAKVKQLEWVDDWSKIPEHAWSAHSGFHRYVIVAHFTGMNICVYRIDGVGDFPTLEDAKAAVQADYEARILAAFNTQTS